MSKREKRISKCCDRSRVISAPAPVRIIEKGLVSDRVVIDTVIRKSSEHRREIRKFSWLLFASESQSKQMDQKEFARLGGLAVKKKYGKDYFKKLRAKRKIKGRKPKP